MPLFLIISSLKKRLGYVYKATKQHALNLARFVAIYKTALLLQKWMAGGKEKKADTFFAGLIGGWFVFSERNAVNEQVSPCHGLVTQDLAIANHSNLLNKDRSLRRFSSNHFFLT